MYKIFSVCTGANGMDLALDHNRFEVIGHAEIDPYASAVLRHHYPKVKNYGDINEEGFAAKLPSFDILTGGTPCQSFSVARAENAVGLKGKSGLFYTFYEILKVCQPSYFVWENVPNARSTNRGMDFVIIQNLLAEAGYELQWQILDSRYFGAAQGRERLYVLGHHRTAKPLKEIFYREWDSDIIAHKDKNGRPRNASQAPSSYENYQGFVAYSKSTRKHHIDHRIRLDGICHTLTTGDGCSSQSSFNYILEGDKLRKPTPLECERIMTWPDNWTKYGQTDDGKTIELSDTQRYKICGNGIVSIVTKELMEEALP